MQIRAKCDRPTPDPNLGTCAAAAATGNVVVTRSFYLDERWAELRHLPLSLGFLAAIAARAIQSQARDAAGRAA